MKATYKGKKEVKKFTLRNVDPTLMMSSNDLKDLSKTNFHNDVKSGDFDVACMVGAEVIRVQTEDLKEMWGEIRKNQCTTLWCDSLVDCERSKSNKSSKPGRKRKRAASDEESDDDEATSSQSTKTQKKKTTDNEIKVQEIVDSLKSQHGTKYTVLQLQIWAELVSSGLYTSTEERPCNNSMFQRAGGGSIGKKKQDQSESGIAQALTAFTQVLTGSVSTIWSGSEFKQPSKVDRQPIKALQTTI